MIRDSLADWLSWLEAQRPEHDMVLGLDRIGDVARRLLPASLASTVITVAGTNGKGSTIALLEAMLGESGLSVGAYTSPHLLRFNERVRIRGEMVSDQLLCEAFGQVDRARGDTLLTWFEMVTLVALVIFSNSALDVVLLEVGLGGRLDAVNIITPDIAIVTTVALDHQEWLGHDIESIAAEKAGIYRKQKPALFGDMPVPASLLAVMAKVGAQPCLRGRDFTVERSDSGLTFRGVGAGGEQVTLSGLVEPELPLGNVACALEAVQWLPCRISVTAMNAGLARVSLAGRMQELQAIRKDGKAVTVILDVAHNPQAANYLAGRLKTRKSGRCLTAVLAMLDDKDFGGVVDGFDGLFNRWHVAAVSYRPRALPAETLANHLIRQGQRVHCHDCVADALDAALDLADETDTVVVFGSFHTVAESLRHLQYG